MLESVTWHAGAHTICAVSIPFLPVILWKDDFSCPWDFLLSEKSPFGSLTRLISHELPWKGPFAGFHGICAWGQRVSEGVLSKQWGSGASSVEVTVLSPCSQKLPTFQMPEQSSTWRCILQTNRHQCTKIHGYRGNSEINKAIRIYCIAQEI